MDGAATSGHDELGRLVRGHSEYAARKRRLAERLAKLRLDYSPSPSQEMLLVVIAGHLDDAERCRSAIARTRATNAARRLLKDIPRRPGPPAPHPDALETARAMLERLGNGDPSAA
jgi:hypothetical protein